MKEVLNKYVAPYRKAIVPLVVVAILKGFEQVGVFGDMSVKEALGLLVTTFFVWLIPNKQA